MKKLLVIMVLGLMTASAIQAQDAPKLEVKPSGRILFDAAYLSSQNQKDELKSGVGVPDVRVGVGFTYGKWKAKIDMGYAYGKVGMKDVWLQYTFDQKNFLRGGYFIHQYGYMVTRAAPVHRSRRRWRSLRVTQLSITTVCLA